MVLAAASSNIDIEFIDGVNGADVVDKAIPKTPDHQSRLSDAVLGSWRAHINAIQESAILFPIMTPAPGLTRLRQGR
jgi:hypothetical protein